MSSVPYLGDAIKNIFKKPLTEDIKAQVAENFRGKLAFDPEKCIGCGLCIRVCAPCAIVKISKAVENGQEITMKYDMGSCTYCGFCADICPKKALTMTTENIIITQNKDELIVEGTFIKENPKKPVSKK